MKKIFVILWIYLECISLYAQSEYTRMILHNGGDSLNLRISRVDSVTFDRGEVYSDLSCVNWGTKISNDSFFHNLSYENISTYTHPTALPYYDLYVEGNLLYAVTRSGLRKLDYSDKYNPIFLGEVTPFLSNQNLQGRSIASKGNNLYVGYRVSYKNYVQDDAQITERFESKINDGEKINSSLSNNDIVNAFFKELTLNCELSRIHQLFLYKAYKRSEYVYSNIIQFKVSGGEEISILRKDYLTREDALSDLNGTYMSASGDYCEVDWSVLPEGSNVYSNISFNSVFKLSYIHTDKADYTISAVHCPNSGNYSGMFSINTVLGDSAIISYNLMKSTDEAETSFWIRVDESFIGDIRIPIFRNNATSVYDITISPSGNFFNMAIDNGASLKSFSNGVWYNIKSTYEKGIKKLYYRLKECTDWIFVGQSVKSSVDINVVGLGVVSDLADANIFFDDFRYSSCDVDAVSYDKGRITVVDKKSMSIKKIINLDYPVTGMASYMDRLVVAGLDGVNVYNLADSDNPELVFSYRPFVFKDIQNTKIYECNGHVYAFICEYTSGVLILDITDLDNVFIAKEDEWDDWKYKNYKKGIYCYDVVVDYPYAYATIAPHPFYSDKIPEACGLVSMDISNLNNITKELYLISPADITSNKNGDVTPTRIARYGNTLYLNNRDKGLAVYDILGHGVVEYKGLVEFNNETSINCIQITDDGLIFMGDDTCHGTCRNINMWRIKE